MSSSAPRGTAVPPRPCRACKGKGTDKHGNPCETCFGEGELSDGMDLARETWHDQQMRPS
jgi:DnaJ-class molecular chaperone